MKWLKCLRDKKIQCTFCSFIIIVIFRFCAVIPAVLLLSDLMFCFSPSSHRREISSTCCLTTEWVNIRNTWLFFSCQHFVLYCLVPDTERKSSTEVMSSTASVRMRTCFSHWSLKTSMLSWATLLWGRAARVRAALITWHRKVNSLIKSKYFMLCECVFLCACICAERNCSNC